MARRRIERLAEELAQQKTASKPPIASKTSSSPP